MFGVSGCRGRSVSYANLFYPVRSSLSLVIVVGIYKYTSLLSVILLSVKVIEQRRLY